MESRRFMIKIKRQIIDENEQQQFRNALSGYFRIKNINSEDDGEHLVFHVEAPDKIWQDLSMIMDILRKTNLEETQQANLSLLKKHEKDFAYFLEHKDDFDLFLKVKSIRSGEGQKKSGTESMVHY